MYLNGYNVDIKYLIWIEDFCWTISWALLALTSFRDRKAGFPPRGISFVLAIDFFLLFYCGLKNYQFVGPLLLSNYILWPIITIANMIAIFKYSLAETGTSSKVFFTAKLFIEFSFLISLFWFLAEKFPPRDVNLYIGQIAMFYLSFQFLMMIIYRNDLAGQSFLANVFRLLAALQCVHLNTLLRDDVYSRSFFMNSLISLTIIFDICYLVIFLKRKKSLDD